MSLTFKRYIDNLRKGLQLLNEDGVLRLTQCLKRAFAENRQVFICGNGGSAANSIHIANDFLYGVGRHLGKGLRVHSLSANPAILTCLANDISYAEIYSEQLRTMAGEGDVLLILSGSGNSPNVLRALETARELGMETAALLGYDGGECLNCCDIPIHIKLDDMQVAEDVQVVVGHLLTRLLQEWSNE
ncbi:phosphoheptose isomerase [Oceanidesulfovibrio marinus]|uniref:Phosphoheptose isomerase n=2 Tax=Oceanidesulfovibrio marinus TaxID=370038 RepID=A0A6P1ZKX2_9BACT|nr:SIS domain-containing protein [Oceanidesulfovibrio marinus]TVM34703.1 phosphoheptose isomerase [Oceanidesulfovibrio marinus]